MDANTPRHEDDLSDFERHLAGWQPASDGLNADAMLFAAGQAAGRRGRSQLLWPVLCCAPHRTGRGAGRVGPVRAPSAKPWPAVFPERDPATQRAPRRPLPLVRESSYEPSPGDYLSTRRLMEQDPNGWLASVATRGVEGTRAASSPTRDPHASPA